MEDLDDVVRFEEMARLLDVPEQDIKRLVVEAPDDLREATVGYVCTAAEYYVRKNLPMDFWMLKLLMRSLPQHVTLKGYERRIRRYEQDMARAGSAFLASDVDPALKAVYSRAAEQLPAMVRATFSLGATLSYGDRMGAGKSSSTE